MLCGNTPFKPFNFKEHDERNIKNSTIENIRKGAYNVENNRWDQITKSAQDLIAKLLKVDESERMALHKLKNHPWLNDASEKTFNSFEEMHRCTESETIFANDADSLEQMNDLVIIDDKQDLVNTQSNDSSSGIVMSEPNGGSVSSSHEEVDLQNNIQSTISLNEKQFYAGQNLFEQIEPENLSLKANQEDYILKEARNETLKKCAPKIRKTRIRKSKKNTVRNAGKKTENCVNVSMDKETAFDTKYIEPHENHNYVSRMTFKQTFEINEFFGFDNGNFSSNFSPDFGFKKKEKFERVNNHCLKIHNTLLNFPVIDEKCEMDYEMNELKELKVLPEMKKKRGRPAKNKIANENTLERFLIKRSTRGQKIKIDVINSSVKCEINKTVARNINNKRGRPKKIQENIDKKQIKIEKMIIPEKKMRGRKKKFECVQKPVIEKKMSTKKNKEIENNLSTSLRRSKRNVKSERQLSIHTQHNDLGSKNFSRIQIKHEQLLYTPVVFENFQYFPALPLLKTNRIYIDNKNKPSLIQVRSAPEISLRKLEPQDMLTVNVYDILS
jgi:Protein kinase domain